VSSRSALLTLALAAAWLSGCSQEPSAPTAATLVVQLATPAQDDGAVLFTISGGPVDSVESLGYPLYTARIDDHTTRVIVVGKLAPGAVARVHIGDDRRLSRYSAAVNQVAARTYAQRDMAGYEITLIQ
jgi:hypothetical protein